MKSKTYLSETLNDIGGKTVINPMNVFVRFTCLFSYVSMSKCIPAYKEGG